eukprot:scaffold51082_cov30-Tisochrysis_lutea.AAC.2
MQSEAREQSAPCASSLAAERHVASRRAVWHSVAAWPAVTAAARQTRASDEARADSVQRWHLAAVHMLSASATAVRFRLRSRSKEQPPRSLRRHSPGSSVKARVRSALEAVIAAYCQCRVVAVASTPGGTAGTW